MIVNAAEKSSRSKKGTCPLSVPQHPPSLISRNHNAKLLTARRWVPDIQVLTHPCPLCMCIFVCTTPINTQDTKLEAWATLLTSIYRWGKREIWRPAALNTAKQLSCGGWIQQGAPEDHLAPGRALPPDSKSHPCPGLTPHHTPVQAAPAYHSQPHAGPPHTAKPLWQPLKSRSGTTHPTPHATGPL